MSGVLVLLVMAVVVVSVTAGIVVTHVRGRSRRELRDRKFRAAILEQENKRDRALMIGKDEPDAYIAEREIIRLRERYIAGKEDIV